MTVQSTASFARDFLHLPEHIQRKVETAIRQLVANPHSDWNAGLFGRRFAMIHFLGGILILLFTLAVPVHAGVDKNKARYVGGTVKEIPEQTEGMLFEPNEKTMYFTWRTGWWAIHCNRIKSLKYGDKSSGFPALMNRRAHFLTIFFQDDQGTKHVAVFEIGKAMVKPILAILELRTGLKIAYESENARKSARQ